ncbi:MAG TPA: hypothetical protein VFO52_14760 [Longimicrobiales bacterium]|nr:hypothetical protein [Longimicrobiales bacterium]
MSSFKAKVQIMLLATVVLLAAGVPAQARRASEVERVAVQRVDTVDVQRTPSHSFFWRWMQRLTRYAMGAN